MSTKLYFTFTDNDGNEREIAAFALVDQDGAPATIAVDTTGLMTETTGQSILTAVSDTTTPMPVVGYTVNPAATQFTRPADTTAYASGDLVANSTTAASVTALQFTVARANGGSGMIRKARIRKSGTSVTNASFRLHLFKNTPSVATTGDNGVFATVVSGVADWIGSLDVSVDRAFADGAGGSGIPVSGSELNFVCDSDDTKLYGLLEARGAYTPANAETFNVSLEVIQN